MFAWLPISRIWDTENVKKHKEVFVFKTNKPSVRSSVSAASFSPDGRYIAAAGTHGPLRIYAMAGPLHRAEKVTKNSKKNKYCNKT